MVVVSVTVLKASFEIEAMKSTPPVPLSRIDLRWSAWRALWAAEFEAHYGVKRAATSRHGGLFRLFLSNAPLERPGAFGRLQRGIDGRNENIDVIRNEWLFDHWQLYTRNKFPFFLISHPYGIKYNTQILEDFRSCGYLVSCSNWGWYKYQNADRVDIIHPAYFDVKDNWGNMEAWVKKWNNEYREDYNMQHDEMQMVEIRKEIEELGGEPIGGTSLDVLKKGCGFKDINFDDNDDIEDEFYDEVEKRDIIQDWIDECCKIGPDCRAENKELYRSFLSWCEKHEIPMLGLIPASSSRRFSSMINDRCFETLRSNSIVWKLGIKLI